jgi:hypothetical protein
MASMGLFWLGRALKRRDSPQSNAEPQSTDSALGRSEGDALMEAEVKSERRARLEAKLDEIVREETARAEFDAQADAMRDLAAEGAIFDENDEELVFDTRRDPQNVDWPQGETVQSNGHFSVADEHYDAIDAEDVGTEWLARATEAGPVEGRDPLDLLEGTNIEDPSVEVDLDIEIEDDFGSDQPGEPLAPYAGVAEEDVAARLPVGNRDENGNVELHAPVLPRDALRAPPTSELSPTEDELARRAGGAARRERH